MPFYCCWLLLFFSSCINIFLYPDIAIMFEMCFIRKYNGFYSCLFYFCVAKKEMHIKSSILRVEEKNTVVMNLRILLSLTAFNIAAFYIWIRVFCLQQERNLPIQLHCDCILFLIFGHIYAQKHDFEE